MAATVAGMARSHTSIRVFPALLLAALAGCEVPTDAATRLAYDLETGAGKLGAADGAKHRVEHATPSKPGECVGPYSVQLDKVGALIVWCHDGAGKTVSSHSTSWHARFIDAPETWNLDKPAGATLTIELERRAGRAVVTGVR
jgi:hypothetical protein